MTTIDHFPLEGLPDVEEPQLNDVTLACNGNQTLQSHKVMVDADSLVCRNLLRKHPIHTLSSMRGARLPLLLPDDYPGHGEFPGPGSENKPGQ